MASAADLACRAAVSASAWERDPWAPRPERLPAHPARAEEADSWLAQQREVLLPQRPTCLPGASAREVARSWHQALAAGDPPGALYEFGVDEDGTWACRTTYERSHPTGGWRSRVVESRRKAWRCLAYYDGDHNGHNEAGPALVELAARDLSPVLVEWMVHGVNHRQDGPAVMDGCVGAAFFVQGCQVAFPDGRGKEGELAVLDLAHEMVRAGREPLTLWMDVACRLDDPERAHELARAGADVVALGHALDAGVVDQAALMAVSTRRAPLSWAAR